MRTLLLLPLLLTLSPSPQDPVVRESSPVVVLSFKWFKDRQPVENAVAGPQPAMTDANKNYERQRRVNSSAGERDPNADTLDNRSNEMEKIVQESRRAQPIDGFIYQIRLNNGSAVPALTIFWEYQFIELANPKYIAT